MAEKKKETKLSKELQGASSVITKMFLNNPSRSVSSMYANGLLAVRKGGSVIHVKYNRKPDKETELLLNHTFIADAIDYYLDNLNAPKEEES